MTIITRESETKIIGELEQVQCAKGVLSELLEFSKRGNTITEQNVDYALAYAIEGRKSDLNLVRRASVVPSSPMILPHGCP